MNGSKTQLMDWAGEFKLCNPKFKLGSVSLCVPFPYLTEASLLLNPLGVDVGAEDVSQFSSGAYTGEVGAKMIVECGARFVIIGHSERREFFGESNEVVVLKVKQALESNLVPVVCVGESSADKAHGKSEAFLQPQVECLLKNLSFVQLSSLIIAYEPIWAIGTGNTATPKWVDYAHSYIRSLVARVDERCSKNIKILYGGSVSVDNAEELLNQPNVDGTLVGGASLKPRDFAKICSMLV